MTHEPLLEHRVVSVEEMNAWPVDRARSGEKRWAETTWGTGPMEGPRRLFYNWNTWPCRVVFEVAEDGPVARGEAVWRRSELSVRMKGLKLLSARTGKEVTDARIVRYDQERVVVEFRPEAGPGLYHLYYGAYESSLFSASDEWLKDAETATPVAARALRIEARCKADDFDPMETVALACEIDRLLARSPGQPYLVFPEDRDRPIKLQFDLPADWARLGSKPELVLQADRHEYRVFQLGVWACRCGIPELGVRCSHLASASAGAVIPARAVQCLTLESRIRSRFIAKPSGPFPVPEGQVRALWLGVDIPEDSPAGEYQGTVTVLPAGLPATEVPIRLIVSDTVVPERGDHDLWRLSRLRWIESDAGLSDEVYPPYEPLRVSPDRRSVSTWGHTFGLGPWGLPDSLRFGDLAILASPIALTGRSDGQDVRWTNAACQIEAEAAGYVEWTGTARDQGLQVQARGRLEYDGCAILTLELSSADGSPHRVDGLTLSIPWTREHARLASGMGYRGLRDGPRCWRFIRRGAQCFAPSLWMGSVKAGLGWMTWIADPAKDGSVLVNLNNDVSSPRSTNPWQDVTRPDAATVTEHPEAVVLRLNLGAHEIAAGRPWRITFALRPTPVKPPDPRHWQFRYMHKGGGFWPSDNDTPQSFLRDGCKRLDQVANELGVKRLNLHDWWGPAFNYAWQWEGPDNLARMTEEAHRRGLFVKVYNSGRELSSFAPEFWALLYEGTGYHFRDAVDPNPRLWFQDAWRQNHLPDGIPAGWPRLHEGLGNEHCIPVSNATRNGNFYLESMRYMTRFFGTDGAYWDGADGPTLGHREMAKRLWVIFRQTNPHAAIDVHHGHALVDSPISAHLLCFPFNDSLWHGEGFDYDRFDPWTWLVEISGIPFNMPSEMLGGDGYVGRGMLFGIWPRHGWYRETDVPRKLWRFFDQFRIEEATMRGWWEENNGVTVDRPQTLVTAFCHPENGVLLAIATWHAPLAGWMEMTFDVTLLLDRRILGLPEGELKATDILTEESVDIAKPLPLPDMKFGRLVWVRASR